MLQQCTQIWLLHAFNENDRVASGLSTVFAMVLLRFAT